MQPVLAQNLTHRRIRRPSGQVELQLTLGGQALAAFHFRGHEGVLGDPEPERRCPATRLWICGQLEKNQLPTSSTASTATGIWVSFLTQNSTLECDTFQCN